MVAASRGHRPSAILGPPLARARRHKVLAKPEACRQGPGRQVAAALDSTQQRRAERCGVSRRRPMGHAAPQQVAQHGTSRHISTPVTGRHATLTSTGALRDARPAAGCAAIACAAHLVRPRSPAEKLRAPALALAALLQPTFNTHDKHYPLQHHTTHLMEGGHTSSSRNLLPPSRAPFEPAPYRASYTSGMPQVQDAFAFQSNLLPATPASLHTRGA